jgi:hypothetical protein
VAGPCGSRAPTLSPHARWLQRSVELRYRSPLRSRSPRNPHFQTRTKEAQDRPDHPRQPPRHAHDRGQRSSRCHLTSDEPIIAWSPTNRARTVGPAPRSAHPQRAMTDPTWTATARGRRQDHRSPLMLMHTAQQSAVADSHWSVPLALSPLGVRNARSKPTTFRALAYP